MAAWTTFRVSASCACSPRSDNLKRETTGNRRFRGLRLRDLPASSELYRMRAIQGCFSFQRRPQKIIEPGLPSFSAQAEFGHDIPVQHDVDFDLLATARRTPALARSPNHFTAAEHPPAFHHVLGDLRGVLIGHTASPPSLIRLLPSTI